MDDLEKYPRRVGHDQRVLVRVQYRTGDVDFWRCLDATLYDRNSAVLHLKDAASIQEDGSVLRVENLFLVLGAVVLWTKDLERV